MSETPLEFRVESYALVTGILVGLTGIVGQVVGVWMLSSGAEYGSAGWVLILILFAFEAAGLHMILEWKNRRFRVTSEWIEITDSLGRVHGPISWKSIERVTRSNGDGGTIYTLHYGSESVRFGSSVKNWEQLLALVKGHLADRWPKG